jgi:transcriptional regulator, XRE family
VTSGTPEQSDRWQEPGGPRAELAEKIAGEVTLSDDPGATLRKWRTEFEIAQADLADALEVSPSVVSDYEGGGARTPVSTWSSGPCRRCSTSTSGGAGSTSDGTPAFSRRGSTAGLSATSGSTRRRSSSTGTTRRSVRHRWWPASATASPDTPSSTASPPSGSSRARSSTTSTDGARTVRSCSPA